MNLVLPGSQLDLEESSADTETLGAVVVEALNLSVVFDLQGVPGKGTD